MMNKPTTISVQLYHSVAALPAEWHALLPAEHFLQPAQLLISEAAALPDVSYTYALVLEHGKPITAAYFQLLHLQPAHIDGASLKLLQKIVWRIASRMQLKILVAGHLFRHDIAAVHCRPETSAYAAYQYYIAAIEAALQQSCASAVLVKDMPAEMATFFKNHEPGYLQVRNDISMQMDISTHWQSLQDYEKSLKHKYAQRFRKLRQSWNGLEVREWDLAQVAANQQAAYALYKQVSEHQQVRLGFISEGYLTELKRYYGDALRVWGLYEGDVLVAFFSAWVNEDAFDMFYIGFDYAANARLHLYFNMLYWAVEQAIALRKPQLILGRTALDAKARLGCKPEYRDTFLYIRNGLLRRIATQIQARIAVQEGAWEERHPFKPQ